MSRPLKKFPVSPIILCASAMMFLSSCGGGGLDGWEKMSLGNEATVSFEMPKPIKMQVDEKSGLVLYAGQKEKEKLSFKVGIQKRNFAEDQAKGMTDEAVLKAFAQQVLQASQQQFAQMGMQTQFQYDGNFTVPTGTGMQFEGKVGKAVVLNRFYVNKVGLYWVEAITQDPNNPDIKRFLDSFSP